MEYQVKSIGKTCAATGQALAPGSQCYSVLVEENGQHVRKDYAPAAWTGPPAGALGYWKATVPQPEQNKPKPLDADALMRYFEQLLEDVNPAQEKLKYVLALLLLQKRRMKIEGSRRDGDIEYIQFIGSQGEGPYEVRDQQLDEAEIEQLQVELNSQLARDWT
jgi:hypothetical protein